jgi:hypothetical protein
MSPEEIERRAREAVAKWDEGGAAEVGGDRLRNALTALADSHQRLLECGDTSGMTRAGRMLMLKAAEFDTPRRRSERSVVLECAADILAACAEHATSAPPPSTAGEDG